MMKISEVAGYEKGVPGGAYGPRREKWNGEGSDEDRRKGKKGSGPTHKNYLLRRTFMTEWTVSQGLGIIKGEKARKVKSSSDKSLARVGRNEGRERRGGGERSEGGRKRGGTLFRNAARREVEGGGALRESEKKVTDDWHRQIIKRRLIDGVGGA